MQELCTGAHTWCSARSRGVLHSRAVRRIACERDARRILSCSHDPQRSLCVRHSSPHMNDVVASVQRGVTCFHWVAELKLVVTGSCDGAVRLWDVAQPTPYARLSAPAAMPVLDVAVVPHLHIVVAYHNNCTVNIWDLQEECLLHSTKIKFPFLGVLGKKVEFGAYCIHPGPPRKNETTEELQEETASSSRPSSPLPGEDDRTQSENNPECFRFKCGEVVITCCEYVCRVALQELRGAVRGAPRDAQRARLPAAWPPQLPAPSGTSLAHCTCSTTHLHLICNAYDI
ncbi:unnamed protein product [Parnassius mnemosyne]|uniref:Uncharacterized protein n=1 Tax=Parnassius mnemosyne TaxID=213953 RepID=A0AAV1L3D3_9NEOP